MADDDSDSERVDAFYAQETTALNKQESEIKEKIDFLEKEIKMDKRCEDQHPVQSFIKNCLITLCSGSDPVDLLAPKPITSEAKTEVSVSLPPLKTVEIDDLNTPPSTPKSSKVCPGAPVKDEKNVKNVKNWNNEKKRTRCELCNNPMIHGTQWHRGENGPQCEDCHQGEIMRKSLPFQYAWTAIEKQLLKIENNVVKENKGDVIKKMTRPVYGYFSVLDVDDTE